MNRSLSILTAVLGVTLLIGSAASSQTSTQPATETRPAGAVSDQSSRPATTTFLGDTGLWYVPTAEVLESGTWSISGYRAGTNYIQGYTNVADFAGTFAVGIKNRAEIFGSFLFDTRIDRDVRPLFVNDREFGGVIDRHPRVNTGWTGDHVGDFFLGAKINFWSESRQDPAAVALRWTVKLPTGDEEIGASTGGADVLIDVITSKEAAQTVDLSGHAGYEFRNKPDGFDVPAGAFRWGGGAAFPARAPVRIFTELNGVVPSSDTASMTTAALTATDGSQPPVVSSTENLMRATVGVTVRVPRGFFAGAGVSWNGPQRDRVAANSSDDPVADYWDWQVRIGYHPGVRTYVAPPPPPSPSPPPPPPPNRSPIVKALCDPCTVNVGQSSTVMADAQDPDGDVLTYRWTAPAGALANAAARQTAWTAPQQEGPVPLTVTVDDGKGGTASDTVAIQVVRPPVKTYAFEDVHFDFDRYSLRPEAVRMLNDAVAALRENPTLRIQIEGHTCNIGTAEYNLALGDRRANAVRDHLVSQGMSLDRLRTVSYGEERPKHDNVREETRRLNRRAALVVSLQQ